MNKNENTDFLQYYQKGSLIEEFEIVQTITQTSRNILFKVQNKSTQTHYALKLYGGAIDSARDIKQFLKEAKILQDLPRHPNLVPIILIGEVNKRPYFVMEHLPQNLAEFVSESEQKVQLATCIRLIKDILEGLVHLHSNGILHLDLKPQNILIDDKKKAVISDFDCAFILPSCPIVHNGDGGNSNELITGITYEYASPQLIAYFERQKSDTKTLEDSLNKNSFLSQQCDLYSVGALFFRLLVGNPVYDLISKSSRKEALELIQNRLNPLAPDTIVNLICDLLQLNEAPQTTTAHECLTILSKITHEPEDYPTLCVEDLDPLNQPSELELQIDRILRTYGHIPTEQFEYICSLQDIKLTPTSIKGNQKFSQLEDSNLNHAITMLIEERRELLSQHEKLGPWFKWADYIKRLHSQKTGKNLYSKLRPKTKIKLSKNQFNGLLEQGYISLTKDQDRAEKVLKYYFCEQSNLASFTVLNLLAFSVFVMVIAILILVFQPLDNNDIAENIPESGMLNENINSNNLNASNASHDGILNDLSSTTAGDLNNNVLKNFPNELNKNIDGNSAVNKNLDNTQQQKLDKDVFKDVIIHPTNKHQFAEIEWQSIKSLDNVRIMKHEVSQQLYQYCVDAGSCRPPPSKKRFSTILSNKPASESEPHHSKLPKVNVTWYDATEQFIPWLSAQLNKNLSLPSLNQWQIIAKSIQNQNKSSVSICLDCESLINRELENSLVPVNALEKDKNGLVHFYGNAQEWLLDCWRNDFKQVDAKNILRVIERCDQAVVAGGSYLNRKRDFNQQQFDRLLKTASSSTVSFRLIWIE